MDDDVGARGEPEPVGGDSGGAVTVVLGLCCDLDPAVGLARDGRGVVGGAVVGDVHRELVGEGLERAEDLLDET